MGNNPTLLKLYSDRFVPGSAVLVQGASSGLGRELAKTYAGRGCPMVVTGRNEEELQKLVQLCQSEYSNYNVFYITGDASKEDDCRKITEFMIKKHGRIDIMVLAAGVTAHGKFENIVDSEVMKKIMDVNLFGYVNMTKYTLPYLKSTKG
jgi:short-subunit dehydrogenase